MAASKNGHYQVVELLLKGEADVNIQNNGWTALMFASDNGHHHIVELLLKWRSCDGQHQHSKQ